MSEPPDKNEESSTEPDEEENASSSGESFNALEILACVVSRLTEKRFEGMPSDNVMGQHDNAPMESNNIEINAFPEHRVSCHRCGNIRKRKQMCCRSHCPHIFCGRCADKMKEEHGTAVFGGGCPVCKELCCCSNKSPFCNRKNHCYRKCPASKNKISGTAAASLLHVDEDGTIKRLRPDGCFDPASASTIGTVAGNFQSNPYYLIINGQQVLVYPSAPAFQSMPNGFFLSDQTPSMNLQLNSSSLKNNDADGGNVRGNIPTSLLQNSSFGDLGMDMRQSIPTLGGFGVSSVDPNSPQLLSYINAMAGRPGLSIQPSSMISGSTDALSHLAFVPRVSTATGVTDMTYPTLFSTVAIPSTLGRFSESFVDPRYNCAFGGAFSTALSSNGINNPPVGMTNFSVCPPVSSSASNSTEHKQTK